MNKTFSGKSRIAKQIGNKGIYGEILLTCEVDEAQIDIQERIKNLKSFDHEYMPGLIFGLAFFVENQPELPFFIVTIAELKTNPVDTRNVVVSYIMVDALYDAFCITEKKILFNQNTAEFLFQK